MSLNPCEVTFSDKWRGSFGAMWRGLPAEGAVHRRAGHREQLGQIADRVIASVVHAAQLLLLPVGQLGLLALELAPGAGNRHALARAEADQVGLELSESGQDVEEHLPHRISRVIDARPERDERVSDGA